MKHVLAKVGFTYTIFGVFEEIPIFDTGVCGAPVKNRITSGTGRELVGNRLQDIDITSILHR